MAYIFDTNIFIRSKHEIISGGCFSRGYCCGKKIYARDKRDCGSYV